MKIKQVPKNVFAKLAIRSKPYLEDNENNLFEELLNFSVLDIFKKNLLTMNLIKKQAYLNSDSKKKDEEKNLLKSYKTCKSCAICR